MTSRHVVVNKYFAFFLIDFFVGLRNCKQHISQRGGLSQTPQPVFTNTKAKNSVGQMTVSTPLNVVYEMDLREWVVIITTLV